MSVVIQSDPAAAAQAVQSATPARASEKAAVARPAPQPSTESGTQKAVTYVPVETNVVFRRDQSGQIYYVFTDAQSGRELQELPPKQVRSVGQGIADLIKELEQKGSNHLEVKG